jgi:DNA-binding PucR family transcriptional regulator
MWTNSGWWAVVVEDQEAAEQKWFDDFGRASESPETLDRLVAVVNDRIVEGVPELRDPTLRPELEASTRSHWKGFLTVMNRETIDVQPAPPIHDFARTLARRGFDLPVLLSAYRIGQRSTWDFITDLLRTQVKDPDLRSSVLLRFWSHATQWIDTVIESLIPVFNDEREQWQRGSLARRTGIVKAILAKQSIDIDTAVTTLGYPLRQHHMAFTLRVDDTVPDYDVHHLLGLAAESVSTALGGGRPLVMSSGARSAWCWTSQPSILLDDGVVFELPRFVRMTLGTCHPGVSGFRLTHLEAIAALVLAERQDGAVVRYADVEIVCLAAGILCNDTRAAFVRRELGGLVGSDDATRRLRETLRVYLKEDGDASATGELLRMHANTVRYRVRQAQQRLGHGISRRRTQLELALEIINFLGIEETGSEQA